MPLRIAALRRIRAHPRENRFPFVLEMREHPPPAKSLPKARFILLITSTAIIEMRKS